MCDELCKFLARTTLPDGLLEVEEQGGKLVSLRRKSPERVIVNKGADGLLFNLFASQACISSSGTWNASAGNIYTRSINRNCEDLGLITDLFGSDDLIERDAVIAYPAKIHWRVPLGSWSKKNPL